MIRVDCIYVSARNGAYLVNVSGPATTDSPDGDCYTAASSVRAAKSAGVRMAREFDYGGRPRWDEARWGWVGSMLWDEKWGCE